MSDPKNKTAKEGAEGEIPSQLVPYPTGDPKPQPTFEELHPQEARALEEAEEAPPPEENPTVLKEPAKRPLEPKEVRESGKFERRQVMPADLNRTNDTPVATLKLMEIAPLNWHRFPTPISAAMVTDIHIPTVTFTGGAYGDETVATANATDAYAPKTQTEYAAFPGTPNSVVPSEAVSGGQAITSIADYTFSTVVNSPRGWIDPNEPYGAAPVSPTDDPTITSLAPTGGVSGAGLPPIWVIITGTKFTPYSSVETGNVPTPYFNYVSPTKMNVLMDAARSTPGIVVVKVIDHGVKSNGSNFTFT